MMVMLSSGFTIYTFAFNAQRKQMKAMNKIRKFRIWDHFSAEDGKNKCFHCSKEFIRTEYRLVLRTNFYRLPSDDSYYDVDYYRDLLKYRLPTFGLSIISHLLP